MKTKGLSVNCNPDKLYQKYKECLQKEETLHEKLKELYARWEKTLDENIGKQLDQVMDEIERVKNETNLLARELIECLYS